MICRGVIDSWRTKPNNRHRKSDNRSKGSRKGCVDMKCLKCNEQPSITTKSQRFSMSASRKKIGTCLNFRCRLIKHNKSLGKLKCSAGRQTKFSPFISQITDSNDIFSFLAVDSLYYYGFKHRPSNRKENFFLSLYPRF